MQRSKAELVSLFGVSYRSVTRLLSVARTIKGFPEPAKPRRSLGRGHGTTPLGFSRVQISKLEELKILLDKTNNPFDRQWHLWIKYCDVQIRTDLIRTLKRENDRTSHVKTLEDVELYCGAVEIPRTNPLRKIFKGLDEEDVQSFSVMVACVIRGIRLHRDHRGVKVMRRVFGLSEEWQMPPVLFDWREKLMDALVTATPVELKAAWRVCRVLDRVVGQPPIPKQDAAILAKAGVPERPVAFLASVWSSDIVRTLMVAVIILWMRDKPTIGEGKGTFALLNRYGWRLFRFAVTGRAGNSHARR
jgi:hypothetical protein